MNYYGNNFSPYPTFNQPQSMAYNGNYQPQMQAPQVKTNKIFVTSLEDALSRYAEPNSIMVYRHQDEKLEFEVITDAQGKKNYKTLVLGDYSPTGAQNTPSMNVVSVEEFEGVKSRLKAIEEELFKNRKQETTSND